MNMALLVIDVQEAFIGHRKNERDFFNTFEYINETAALFRKAGSPVIVIRDVEGGEGEEYQNVEALKAEQGDIEVLKTFGNSFWKTNLESILREQEVDFVVLCGNAEEYCVLATYNGAIERSFGVAMLQHGLFAQRPEGLLDAYQNRSLISYAVLSYILKK